MLFITKRTANRREQELQAEIDRLRDELVFQQHLNMPETTRRLDEQVKDLLDWDRLVETGAVHAWDSPSLRLGLCASRTAVDTLMAVTYDNGKAWRTYVTPAEAADAYKERFLASA